jgi:hypothetical protein
MLSLRPSVRPQRRLLRRPAVRRRLVDCAGQVAGAQVDCVELELIRPSMLTGDGGIGRGVLAGDLRVGMRPSVHGQRGRLYARPLGSTTNSSGARRVGIS